MRVNELTHRLVLTLSEPSMSDSDFSKFSNWLRNGGLDQCISAAELVRQELKAVRMPSDRSDPIEPVSEQVTQAVKRLLCVESRIEPRDAVKQLIRRLGTSQGPSMLAPFSSAISKLVDQHGGSAVLSAAQQIRNEIVHQQRGSNWPLEDKQ